MAEQTEWANDFRVPLGRRFGRLVPTLVRHGIENLHCTDVLKYLAKATPVVRQRGQIDLRERPEGTRLKFWYGTNSLKMYDKEKIAFRPETTINQPKEFNGLSQDCQGQRRTKLRNGGRCAKEWRTWNVAPR